VIHEEYKDYAGMHIKTAVLIILLIEFGWMTDIVFIQCALLIKLEGLLKTAVLL
jgi:hypothetical protein